MVCGLLQRGLLQELARRESDRAAIRERPGAAGGSWLFPNEILFRCAFRYRIEPADSYGLIGFRCAVRAGIN